jgi:thiosulfate/3-mercaptopyruvate sulfurtransferase
MSSGYFYLFLFIGYNMPWLINAAQLDKFRKSQKNVVILDASWHLPTENRQAREEYLQSHIAGARFIDLDQFSDQSIPLPNMLITDEHIIAARISKLGITPEHKIIFYDSSPLHTSCRALWMFKVFGHNPAQLYILDGGYSAWETYGGKIETGEPRQVSPKHYAINFKFHLIRTLSQMKDNLRDPKEQVMDMRHPVRFAGGPESRPHMRAGHIPGSFSFPYFTMFEINGCFKPLEKIRKQIMGMGVELFLPIVSTCGSAITATILNFVLDLIDEKIQHAVYDGSWSEWGAETLYAGETSLSERPVVTSLED